MQTFIAPTVDDPELVLIEKLAQEVIENHRLRQIVFEDEYRSKYYQKNRTTLGELRYVSFQATRDHSPTSFEEALRHIVTSEEEAKGQAILFKVRLRAKEILAKIAPKKKKKEVKEIPIPHPPSARALRRVQMERDILDSTPRLPGDEEPGYNPNTDEPGTFLTVGEMRGMVRKSREREEEQQEVARLFLDEPPTPKTVEFDFVRGFGPPRRGEWRGRRRL